MKKLLLSFVVLSGALATAQVGINTDAPQAMLDISAKDNQKGDLRIQDVDKSYEVDWILTWDEKDKKVRRTSIKDIAWEKRNKEKTKYIKSAVENPNEVIEKIRECPEDRLVYDKLFGKDNGKYDFVYCATPVSVGDYSRTWLNLNLGAEYANIHSSHFEPTVSKTGTDAHNEAKTYGSLYQWQRASDGHEFRNSEPTTELADTWKSTGKAAKKFVNRNLNNWVKNGESASGPDLELWSAKGDNNPCPSGYHVPTAGEWRDLFNAVGSNNNMWSQNKLPNLAAAGYRSGSNPIPGGKGANYWSSTNSSNSQAQSTGFSDKGNNPNLHLGRAYGFSVRCIKSK